jgi:uncharacterized 2Fe-2S/4Fe-4S cluster protein (DUF4445 family)
MSERYAIELVPIGIRLELERGAPLDAALFPYGFEFPCGGAGTCGACRVRVLAGTLDVTPEMNECLTPAELAAGWRLACRGRVESALTLEVAQWAAPVLSDDGPCRFEPGEGCGIAIDLGTTTLVAQIVDLATGDVIGVQTGRNPQGLHGADVMSRIEYAGAGGSATLAGEIRRELGAMVAGLPRREEVRIVMLAGNTAMHHLFCGIDTAPLAHVPFEPVNDGVQSFSTAQLGWSLPAEAVVEFLPCLGGFVGSDVLAGILATGIGESAELAALIDLGTNGEIVVGDRGRLLCASTAAGPAFEGGRIRLGMNAASGAISAVALRDGALECRTIGGGAPRGICGSGLVDAAAAGLASGDILSSGRLRAGLPEFPLADGVSLTQADIRELQLAKGAIAAGLRILVARWGAELSDLRTVYLAGAFGNYVDTESARRIGLLEVDPSRVQPSGNTSLRGVKTALLSGASADATIDRTRAKTAHLPLAADPLFQESFVASMPFP